MGFGKCDKYIESSKKENEKHDQKDWSKRERTITIVEQRCPCRKYHSKDYTCFPYHNPPPCDNCNHEYVDHAR